MDRQAIINDFLQRYAEDWVLGKQRTLDEYQARWPGHEPLIAEQYRQIAAQDSSDGEGIQTFAGDIHDSQAPEKIGPYRIISELGRGGQGVVYLAEDTRLPREVALKVLTGMSQLAPQALSRFRREAEVASRLDHPLICTVYETGYADDCPFIAMRYVKGRSLAAQLADTRRAGDHTPNEALPTTRTALNDVLTLVAKLCRATHFAHQNGVIHRDIKPGNIILTPEGDPVLLDFGLARNVPLSGAPATFTQGIFGTPAYLAPEQVSPEERPRDQRVDVYALGVTAFELLTLRRPFASPTREQLYRALLTEPPPDARRFNPAISKDLAVVLNTALEKDPERRYLTAEAFARDLLAVRDGRPITAKAPSLGARFARWLRREPAWAALVLCALLLTGASGYLVARWPDLRYAERVTMEREASALIETGYLEFAEGDQERSLASFRQAYGLTPEDPEALTGLVLALLRIDLGSEALALLDEEPRPSIMAWLRHAALRRQERYAEAQQMEASLPAPVSGFDHLVVGAAHLERGHSGEPQMFELATDHLTRAVVDPSPRAPHGHFLLADALGHHGDARLARIIASTLRARWPESSHPTWLAGWALHEVDPSASAKHYEDAIQLDPENPRPHTNLGVYYARQERNDLKAKQSFERALALAPLWERPYILLGGLRDHVGDADGNIEWLKKGIHSVPPSEARKIWVFLAEAYLRKGNAKESLEAAEHAVLVLPRSAQAHVAHGRALFGLNEYRRAEQAFRRALDRGDDTPSVWQNVGATLQALARPAEALAAFRRIQELQPTFNLDEEFAIAFLELGRFADALQLFEKLPAPRKQAREALIRVARQALKDQEAGIERLLAGTQDPGRIAFLGWVAHATEQHALALSAWDRLPAEKRRLTLPGAAWIPLSAARSAMHLDPPSPERALRWIEAEEQRLVKLRDNPRTHDKFYLPSKDQLYADPLLASLLDGRTEPAPVTTE